MSIYRPDYSPVQISARATERVLVALRGTTLTKEDAEEIIATVKQCTEPEPAQFMGIDPAVPGSDRTVYYQRNSDGTYTELEGIPNE